MCSNAIAEADLLKVPTPTNISLSYSQSTDAPTRGERGPVYKDDAEENKAQDSKSQVDMWPCFVMDSNVLTHSTSWGRSAPH